MNKKYIIWIGSGLVIGGLGYLGYDWWQKKQDEKDSAKAKADEEAIAKASSTTTTATPKPTRVVASSSSTYPLQKGSRNDKVKELQLALGIPETTIGFGYFGDKTLTALQNAVGKDSIANDSEFKIVIEKIRKNALSGGTSTTTSTTKQADIDYLVRRKLATSAISSFDEDYIKAWASGARNGQYVFEYKGGKYKTKGGRQVQGTDYEYLINNNFTTSNIYGFDPAFVKAWADGAKNKAIWFAYNGKFYKVNGGSQITTVKEGNWLVANKFGTAELVWSKTNEFIAKWYKNAKFGAKTFLFNGVSYYTLNAVKR